MYQCVYLSYPCHIQISLVHRLPLMFSKMSDFKYFIADGLNFAFFAALLKIHAYRNHMRIKDILT